MYKKLLNAMNEKTAKIGIVGLGYVGLPLALTFVFGGYEVLGFDIDASKVSKLNKGVSYIKHISDDKIAAAIGGENFIAVEGFERVSEVDAIILCVPTPLNKFKEPDLKYILTTMDEIKDFVRCGQVISLESTTYPGTTREIIKPFLDNAGLTVGEDIFLVYSPEREDPGNLEFETKTIPKVVGGITKECLEIGINLYKGVIDTIVPVSSTEAAELTKLLENIYRSVNIGLVNEMKIVADKMGIDLWEVINAAASKPFGFTAFYPGPGWGGHCIPIDPFYLTWKAKEFGVNTRFIEYAGEINTMMPEWVISKVADGLNNLGKPIKNSKVLVLGLAYKKNIDDTRESPSVKLMELLRSKGAEIYYSDPYVPAFPIMRNHVFDLTSTPITKTKLNTMDCVLISTAHDSFDYDLILKESKLIVDTRGVYTRPYDNVIKA